MKFREMSNWLTSNLFASFLALKMVYAVCFVIADMIFPYLEVWDPGAAAEVLVFTDTSAE